MQSRYDDDAAVDCRRFEAFCEFEQSDLLLILVPVIAAGKQKGRPAAIPDDDDRNTDRSP